MMYILVFIALVAVIVIWLFQSRGREKQTVFQMQDGGADMGRSSAHTAVDETHYIRISPVETALTDVNRSAYRKEWVQKLQPNDPLELSFKDNPKNPDMIQVQTGHLDIGNINKKLQPEISPQMRGGYILQPKIKSVTCEADKYKVTIQIERWKPNEPYTGSEWRFYYSKPPETDGITASLQKQSKEDNQL